MMHTDKLGQEKSSFRIQLPLAESPLSSRWQSHSDTQWLIPLPHPEPEPGESPGAHTLRGELPVDRSPNAARGTHAGLEITCVHRSHGGALSQRLPGGRRSKHMRAWHGMWPRRRSAGRPEGEEAARGSFFHGTHRDILKDGSDGLSFFFILFS